MNLVGKNTKNLVPGTKILTGLLIVLIALSCSPGITDKPQQVIFDLAALEAEAELSRQTAKLDFGTDSAWPHLASGWLKDTIVEEDGHETSVAISVGDTSLVRFFVVSEVSEIPVRMRLAPVNRPRITPMVVSLKINGANWETLVLENGFQEFAFNLSPTVLIPGWNWIEITNTPASVARKMAPNEDRRLAWDYLEFSSSSQEDGLPVKFDSTTRTLSIPPWSSLSFVLETPAGSSLAMHVRSSSVADGATQLRLSWRDEATFVSRTLEITADGSSVGWPLNGPSATLGQLDLTVLGPSALVLEQPRVTSSDSLNTIRRPTAAPDRPKGRERPPDVIIYLVDTLRADHLGCYGYARNTTPSADAFAREAVLFENSIAQSPWTRASVASILTGLWPQAHGANGREDVLPEESLSLVEILGSGGYETAAFVTNANVAGPFGFAQGFETFFLMLPEDESERFVRSDIVNQRIFDWLDRRSDDRPMLLWVHTTDPHVPYDPPEPFRSRFAVSTKSPTRITIDDYRDQMPRKEMIPPSEVRDWVNLYDGEIAANDASFGALLEGLKKRALFDDALVIFLSDHGEEFYEHFGWGHGKTLYPEVLNVPLIIKPPRWREPTRVQALAQNIDILPTVVDFSELPVPAGIQGRSLRGLMANNGTAGSWDSPAVVSMSLGKRHATGMIDNRWKIIVAHHGDFDAYPQLFDSLHDSSEFHDLGPAEPLRAQSMAIRMNRSVAEISNRLTPERVVLEKQLNIIDNLRALGYLE